ncbi:carboxypeptidase B [Drosophila obscura]|uniref:carboxypeptidase B n=1 Tax=Drosophila obscura TaxID=7282 RepID=UPI001BB17B98|nr:carboxypeptidase B [Drosophila obscura]
MRRALCAIILFVAASVASSALSALDLNGYYSYDGVMNYLDLLAMEYPQRVLVKDAGRTFENRILKTITITNGDWVPGKRAIFMDAALHAREWMTPMAALYAIHELVVNFKENADLLQNFNWIVLPLANPDGYVFSRNSDRWWRNNRSPNGGECFGTNLNRNFDVAWRQGYAELSDPCTESYAGSEPFSEAETRLVRDIMHQLVDNGSGTMYLSLHTANRSLFYPWVHESSPTRNHQELQEIALFATDRILRETQTVIKPKQAYYYGGMVGGISLDYAFKVGFPLSFVFEMSGLASGVEYKFFPPHTEIRRLAMESWVGIRALAEKAIEKYPPGRAIPRIPRTPASNKAPGSPNFNILVGLLSTLLAYVANQLIS